jgi:MFS family permease
VSERPHLLRTRRFLPLFITQFLGALNDNVLKNALVVLLTFQAARWTTLQPAVLANLAAGIFILPFFLFSATAGQLADKHDKARIARLVKLIEVVIVLLAGLGFLVHSLAVLLGALFLLGLHSTLFGPVKYAILPQHLTDAELVGGNALVEAGTFVAILLGTLFGGLLAAVPGASGAITLAGLGIAVAGYLASCRIPAAPPPVPDLVINANPAAETWRILRHARMNRSVFLAILGISWFWLYGALFLAQFPALTRQVLGGSETAVTLLLAVFTVGIGTGSLLCGRLSRGCIELGFVPLGAIGLTCFGFDFAMAAHGAVKGTEPLGALALLDQAGTWRILADLALIGICGGFYIVPLYTLMQQRSEISHRARVIAANNILNALLMVGGAIAAMLLLGGGLSIPALFAVVALGNAVVALYLFSRVPEYAVRFLVGVLAYGLRRLQVDGMDLIPRAGPVLLECDGMAAADALLLMAVSPRPIRCVVPSDAARGFPAAFVFAKSNALLYLDVPLPPATFAAIETALAAGELVAIFGTQATTVSNVLRLHVALAGRSLRIRPA